GLEPETECLPEAERVAEPPRDHDRLARERVTPLAFGGPAELRGELAQHSRAEQAVRGAERGARLPVEGPASFVDDGGGGHHPARLRVPENCEGETLAVTKRARHLDGRGDRLAIARVPSTPLHVAEREQQIAPKPPPVLIARLQHGEGTLEVRRRL